MSTSTSRRRNTVHDFSTLRLHPDGSRVAINSPTRTGPHDSRSRNTGCDTRGNRVARDAAGLGVIPKRTAIREDEDDDNGDDGEEDDVRNIKPRMPLRRKRRRIEDDVEFLGDSGSGARRTTIANGEATKWPVPSSDLLKCVHYFTSQYYSSRGLLSDRSRMYRRELRQGKAKAGVAQATNSGAEVKADADVDADADDLSTGDDEDSENENAAGGEGRCIVKGRERSEGKGLPPEESVQDMYKALDGSALMAIGMLLQEHVSVLLKPNIPPGWEEEMEAAGLVPEDEKAISLDDGKTAEDDAESDKSEDEDVISFESVVSDEKD